MKLVNWCHLAPSVFDGGHFRFQCGRKSYALTLASSSMRIERDNLKHLLPHFGRLLVCDVEASDVGRYQQLRISAGASPKTVNLEVGTLRAILRRNRRWSDIQLDVRMLPTADDIGHALTELEENRLLDACRVSRSRLLHPAVVIGLSTAMRYGEIRLLTWAQIDLSAATLRVGKSKTSNGTGHWTCDSTEFQGPSGAGKLS
jgi:integrase